MAQCIRSPGTVSRWVVDPWSNGTGIMRTVLTRWSGLEITQIGSLLAIASTVPFFWDFLNRAWGETYRWIRQFFLASVAISSGDPICKAVDQWIQDHRPRQHRTFAARSEPSHSYEDRAAALRKSRLAVQYCPYWVSRWIMFNGHMVIIARELDSPRTMLSNTAYEGGFSTGELTVSCFGRSAQPIMSFLDECRDYAEKQTQFFVIIYSRDRFGLSWKPKARTPVRLLETVYFDNVVKQELVTDLKTYLHPKTRRKYETRSMPYRRGYLFYGPPGTGKTSLTIALAGEFGLDLYEIKVPSVASDVELEQMFAEIPPRCIVLLEDIDVVWSRKTLSSERKGNTSEDNNQGSSCTLSGLLNVLDGIGSQEGRIAIMTTNQPELLDSALIRPGRVDMRVFLGNISQNSAQQMFQRMFSPELDVAGPLSHRTPDEIQMLGQQFAAKVPDDTFTPSQLQGFFQKHLDSPEEAVECIEMWIKEEFEKGEQEFEMVARKRKGLGK